MLCGEQRRRCCAFSALFTINSGAKKSNSCYGINDSTPSVLRFLSVIRHESPRYNYAFSKKAQHLRRWISLRTFTRGRLVPRQPRAFKRTTRTELRRYNIQNGWYVHWNIGIKPTALCGYNIQNGRCVHWNTKTFCYLFIRMLVSIVLQNACFNAVGVVLLIAQGCQTIVQATLG